MALFSWFNTQKVDTFVAAEVAELKKRVPPSRFEAGSATPKKASEHLSRAHDQALRHARDFVVREKPNLYQKSRIANSMKWALLEAKYPKPFVDEFTYALAAVVAAATSNREL